jgi:curved DNA-binding protein CbpA
VLGVPPTATAAQLKAAHRALVRRHHPDLAPADQRAAATRLVQEINVAYGLVRDPASRAAYDRALAGSGAGLELLAAAAGRWAGRWWARNRTALLGNEPLARRAGKTVGRLRRRF